MNVPLAAIATDRDMASDFSGLITAVIDVQVTFVVQSRVPPVTPLCMSKGIDLQTIGDCWFVHDKSTVLTMLAVDFATLVKVDLSVTNFVLDSLAVGDMTDSCKR